MLNVKIFSFNPLGTNCYVISDSATGDAVIIDCGALYDMEKAAISDYITAQGLHPTAHVLTHAHFDHLWGADYLHDRYGLAVRCPDGDLPIFQDIDGQMRQLLGHALRCPVAPAGEVIRADSVIRVGNLELTVIPSPGHTPGGVCYYCASERALFSGDSLFQMSIGRTDLSGGNHWELIRSLRRLLRSLPDDVIIYPGHGPQTSVGFERENNPYLNG